MNTKRKNETSDMFRFCPDFETRNFHCFSFLYIIALSTQVVNKHPLKLYRVLQLCNPFFKYLSVTAIFFL
jgi:hypothetical protein